MKVVLLRCYFKAIFGVHGAIPTKERINTARLPPWPSG